MSEPARILPIERGAPFEIIEGVVAGGSLEQFTRQRLDFRVREAMVVQARQPLRMPGHFALLHLIAGIDGIRSSNCRACSRAIRLTELELKPIRTAMTLKLRPLAFSAMMPADRFSFSV
jgi:hypothetical protein